MNPMLHRPPTKAPSETAGSRAVPPVAVHFLVPGPLTTPAGGFVYDRQMIRALAGCGRLASVITLPDRFPAPPPQTIAHAFAALAAMPANAWIIVDGLALPALASALGHLNVIALVHHPVCDETGLSEPARRRWFAEERDALAAVRHVIATSETTARRIRDFGVPRTRVAVVAPAVDDGPCRVSGPAFASRDRERQFLCVGSIVPRKGHDLLLHAFGRLRHLRWRLTVVGAARDRAFAGRVRRLARSLAIDRRIVWRGAVSERARDISYRNADMLVHPARHEGFGMVAIEAVARGKPVIAFDIEALQEAVPPSCRWLVPPADVGALARALRRVLCAPASTHALCRNARREARTLRRWSLAKDQFVTTVARIMARDTATLKTERPISGRPHWGVYEHAAPSR